MLYKCLECGKEISDKAPACPGCGVPTNAAATEIKKRRRALARIIGLTLVMLVLWLMTLPTKSGPPNNEEAESYAAGQLRVINTAEVTYASVGGRYGTIQDMIAAGFLDRRFAAPISGYMFDVRLQQEGQDYLAIATPVGNAGRYSYSSTSDAVIRYAAGPTGTPIGQPSR